ASWWQALLEAGQGGAAGTLDLLDCGAAPAHALEAMRIGLRGIVLQRTAPGWERVAAIAVETGVRLLSDRPSSLDLAVRGAERRLAAWVADEPDDRPVGLG
ncbi:MAG: hypothetical protein J0H99_07690, partial [Rhodospirillales bacterium]|nr:hypothetical protein [Rhodospirillales bacterium]